MKSKSTFELNRRRLLEIAGALGASLALPGGAIARARRAAALERRDLFPEGVASADPHPDSVILWTRRPGASGERLALTLEVAEDEAFRRLAAIGRATVSAESDWTCRVLAAGLKPDRPYWYRFVDETGAASRTGRTFTAPDPGADRPACFAFVSCQNVNLGLLTPYRRMIADDEARPDAEQLRFVLHLGDFIYEMVWYPEDRPDGLQGRQVRGTVRLPHGERIADYQVPAGLEDYRAIYRAYLSDPDLQDARARWPFICVWDNHEFTSRGWQSMAVHDRARAAQRLKVAANQAWFEYVPARVAQPGRGMRLDRFAAPAVDNVPMEAFDAQGLCPEPNNLRAISSLLIARALRWGRHVELLLTDTRSFRSQPVLESPAGEPFRKTNIPFFASQTAVEVLDFGQAYAGGRPPREITFAGKVLPNPRRDAGPGSMLGAVQKGWLLAKLRRPATTWTLWGNSVGMLDLRADPSNLPPDQAAKWPTAGYGLMSTHDWSGYPAERAEILGAARDGGARLVSLAGDRHAFYAGLVSPSLDEGRFAPAAAEFIVGSVTTASVPEVAAHALPRNHPLAPIYLSRDSGDAARPALNVTLRHGVKSSLELARTGSAAAAMRVRNPALAPHLAFADSAGHGFARVTAAAGALDVEFVCMPAPLGPGDDRVLYRASHRLEPWSVGGAPRIVRTSAEGAALAERFLDEQWS